MNTLVWFRNDLRVQDNHSLFQACRQQGKVIAVYFFDPRQFAKTKYGFKKTEKFRARFLLETVQDLKNNLDRKNIPLLVFHDTPENGLPKLIADYDITTVFSQKEWTPEEATITDYLEKAVTTVRWMTTYDQFLFHPDDLPYSGWSKIPEVFTEFRKKCEKETSIRPCVTIAALPVNNRIATPNTSPTLQDLGFTTFEADKNTAFPFNGGETQALKRIQNYFYETQNLSQYKQTRNRLVGEHYSSKLSAWLANGSISPRTIYWEVQHYKRTICKNEDTYWLIFELICAIISNTFP
jgi:deoxyribodipyrimidine photo-lyase